MTKKKSFLLATLLLVFTLALSCVAFTACEPEEPKENRAITWAYDAEVVTVAATGYETLPTELLDGTEVSFTVTVKDGYTLGTVSGAQKQDDGSYKLTVNKKDVNVKINATKTLNGIEVAVSNPLVYFEGQTVDTSLLTVTAKYALGDEVITEYTIAYQNGSSFAVGDTSFTVSFGGKQATVELASAVTAPQEFHSAKLVVEDDVLYLVAEGFYNAAGTVEEAEATVEGWFNNCMERNTWATMTFNVDVTMNQDKTFTIKASVDGMTTGHQYYFHIKDGADGQDFACSFAPGVVPVEGLSDHGAPVVFPGDEGYSGAYTEEATYVQTSDGTKYYIGTIPSWGSVPIIICPINESAPKFTNVGLEVKDGKPYAVFNGTAGVTTTVEDLEATLLNLINHLDMEDVSNGNAKLADYVNESAFVADETTGETKAFFEINAEAGTFKLYCLLEGDAVVDGANFFAHLGAQGTDGYYPNVSLAGDAENSTITCNGFTFTFTDAATIGLTESWQAALLYINVTAAA